VIMPLFGVCTFMCVVSGWMSVLVSIGMIAGLFVIKGIEMAVPTLVDRCTYDAPETMARPFCQDE